MPEIDWNAEAKRAANYIGENLMAAHRGVMTWRHVGVLAVFGNDGYDAPDGRARKEVAHVRGYVTAANDAEELGFATSDDGESYTWAMLVRSDDPDSLDDAVWEGWRVANGDAGPTSYEAVQRPEAARTLARYSDGPDSSVN